MGPQTGSVQVYMKHIDPMIVKPHMVLKHKVSSNLKPILKSLACGYSEFLSAVSYFLVLWINLIMFIIDDNHCVFVYEEEMWTIKGRYETALEDNREATWSYENGQDIMHFLVVSIFYGIFIF